MGDNVEVLRRENDHLSKQLQEICKEVQTMKKSLKTREPKQHGVAKSFDAEPPNATDVQWLSDGYDELKETNDRAEEKLTAIELRLYELADRVSQISKAVDELQLYSFQYNLKIVGVPLSEVYEKAGDTVKKCLDIFSGIGASVKEFDIDTAHRVPTRRQNSRGGATGSSQPIICTFTRRIAKEAVMAKRKETGRLQPEIFGLPEDSEFRIGIYTHLTPRLQDLLHAAKSFQQSHDFKYCWAKDSMILLRKSDQSRVYKLRHLEDLEALRLSSTQE